MEKRMANDIQRSRQSAVNIKLTTFSYINLIILYIITLLYNEKFNNTIFYFLLLLYYIYIKVT